MKLLKILLTLLIPITANSQIKKGDVVRVLSDLQTTSSINLTDDLTKYETRSSDYSIETIPSGYLYSVKSKTSDAIKLMPLNFKKYTINRIKRRNKRFGFLDNMSLDKSIYSNLYNNKIFEVKSKDFEHFIEKVEDKDIPKFPSRISIGVITLPFKYRPKGEGSFNTEFNINTTVNIRLISVYSSHLYAQLGTGFGSVNLNKSNSGLTEDTVQDSQTLSFLSGLMLQYNRIQFGMYAGFDKINNQSSVKWKNNGEIWIGFGAGYNLFKNKEEESN